LTSSTFPLVRRSQYSLAGTFHGQKIPLAENRFLQADKMELKIQRKKSRQCFILFTSLDHYSPEEETELFAKLQEILNRNITSQKYHLRLRLFVRLNISGSY
jgi:hypothetical protein